MKKILVIDDDLMFIKLIQKLLSDSYEVVSALSGIQALHIVEEEPVDLVLLDIELPGGDGFSILEQLRALDSSKNLPVIFITGRTDRDSMKQCAAVGAVGFVEKPIDKRFLLHQIESALGVD